MRAVGLLWVWVKESRTAQLGTCIQTPLDHAGPLGAWLARETERRPACNCTGRAQTEPSREPTAPYKPSSGWWTLWLRHMTGTAGEHWGFLNAESLSLAYTPGSVPGLALPSHPGGPQEVILGEQASSSSRGKDQWKKSPSPAHPSQSPEEETFYF